MLQSFQIKYKIWYNKIKMKRVNSFVSTIHACFTVLNIVSKYKKKKKKSTKYTSCELCDVFGQPTYFNRRDYK